MPPPWISLIDLLRNGEAVSAGVTNRPIQELSQRTDYLKSLLDTLSVGKAIFDIDVAMSMSVREGFAVYWDETNQEYAPALANLSYNAEGVYGGNADSAYVLGVCAGKSAQTRGTVVFGGRSDGIDFSEAIEGGGTLQPGPYYLSATEAGKMTRSRPPVGIYVMFGLNGEEAIVAPLPRDVLDDHIHYQLPLTYATVIEGVDNTGWTAVYDPALAPADARFRYSVETDPTVYKLFPFYPATSVYFDIDGIGAAGKVVVDANGIWWVEQGFDPDDYNAMTVYYAKISLSTSNLMVRTLNPVTTDSPLTVVDCNGNPAEAGDLFLKFNLQFEQAQEVTAGWLVFKELTTGQQFKRGPVVQRVKSASPEIVVSINGANGYTWDDGYLSGDLLITYLSPSSVTRNLDPTLTELHGALQEDYNSIPYVALPAQSFQSGVSFRFDVPGSGIAGDFSLAFNAWIYSSTAGTFPTGGLAVTFTIIRAVTDLAAKQLSNPLDVISVTGKSLTLLPNTTMNANGYRTAVCTDLDSNVIQPGDQVIVRITRDDAVYAGTIGILKAWSVLTQA